MKNSLIKFVMILLFLFSLINYSANANLFREKYSFPPEWKVGESWKTKTSLVLTILPSADNKMTHFRSGWIITKFTVKDVYYNDEGKKTYTIEMEEIVQEDQRPVYPEGTHFFLSIDQDFALKRIARISSTEEMAKKSKHRRGYAKDLYAKEEGEIVEIYTARSMGGYYGFDCDQETPNTQISTMEYADGSLVQLDVRNLYTNSEGSGTLFYGTKGWMKLGGRKWETFHDRNDEPGPSKDAQQAAAELKEAMNLRGRSDQRHFYNFLDAVRAQDRSILRADVLEGHLSTSMCHLCNIAYRTGKTLVFDSESESFIGDEDANRFVSREYRYPYVIPDEI